MSESKDPTPVVSTSRITRTLKLGQMVARMGVDVAVAGSKAALRKLDDATGFAETAHLRTAEAMVQTLGELKGAALKLGQLISYVDDSIPPQYRQILAKLQADAPKMDFATVQQVIEAELGAPPEQLFAWIDPEPLAAASIGQVHRATLFDGRDAVIKVQFPGVADAIEADIKNAGFLYLFAQVAVRNVTAADLRAELMDVLLKECDYRIEATHQAQFREIWRDDPRIYVPEVFPALSSRRVLTSEFIAGQRFQEFLETAPAAERNAAGYAMLQFTWHSLLYHGLFNGDPHPGNYIFREDGRVAFLDYGCVKHFTPETVGWVKAQIRAIHHQDVPGLLEAKRRMGSLEPGVKAQGDEIMKIYRYIHRPWLNDELFTYTPEYTRESFAMLVSNPAARAVRIPRDFIFVNRWQWGLNAVLANLRATHNFHQIIREFV